MDSNETLRTIRDITRNRDHILPGEESAVLQELLDNVTALDDWLSAGGFAPVDWRASR